MPKITEKMFTDHQLLFLEHCFQTKIVIEEQIKFSEIIYSF